MKKVKDFLASVLYKVVLLLARLRKGEQKNDHLLIVKLDEIGDYMLFRNCLQHIRESEPYKNHRITLLGNEAWKEIFELYDKLSVDDVIWINKRRFKRDLWYRYKQLLLVRQLGTSTVINFVFSRSLSLDDGFCFVATGHKIAMQEDPVNTNRGRNIRNADRFIYSTLINCGKEPQFDGLRNTHFCNILTNAKHTPQLSLSPKAVGPLPKETYYIIFLGAGNKIERQWPIQHFVQCAQFIHEKVGYTPVICGTQNEQHAGQEFASLFEHQSIDLVGKTTLNSFIYLASQAKFMLSVDTGTVHMAASAGCPVVALFSGVHYGRYGPYPASYSKAFYAVYPDLIEQYIENNDEKLFDSFSLKNAYIRTINPEKVIPHLQKIISN
jgi:ADP-heptose:LPS heptosyltransferase